MMEAAVEATRQAVMEQSQHLEGIAAAAAAATAASSAAAAAAAASSKQVAQPLAVAKAVVGALSRHGDDASSDECAGATPPAAGLTKLDEVGRAWIRTESIIYFPPICALSIYIL